MNMFFWISVFEVVFISIVKSGDVTGRFNYHMDLLISRNKEVNILYGYDESLDRNNTYLRVYIEANIQLNDSILIILRDGDDLVNFMKLSNYNNVSTVRAVRTICPILNELSRDPSKRRILTAALSSESTGVTKVRIVVVFMHDFLLELGKPRNVTINDMSPAYFQYKFRSADEIVNLKVQSLNTTCMILSIQKAMCPVHDLIENVKSVGRYQTVSLKGSMVIEADKYKDNRIFVVFVHNSNNEQCQYTVSSSNTRGYPEYTLKVVSFGVYHVPNSYVLPVLLPFIVYPLFAIIATVIFVRYYKNRYNKDRHLKNSRTNGIQGDRPLVSDTEQTINNNDRNGSQTPQGPKYSYFRITIFLGVLYSIPALQLLITCLKMLYVTGNEDICYFNFHCTRPLLKLKAFNHVFSNIGYAILGLTFLVITFGRYHYTGPNSRRKVDSALYYSMGVALIVEGIMSAGYHICPSQTNFQFDTTFMYTMVCLCIIKIHESLNPNIPSASWFFIFLACIIVIGVFGQMYYETAEIWIRLLFVSIIIICLFILLVSLNSFDKGNGPEDSRSNCSYTIITLGLLDILCVLISIFCFSAHFGIAYLITIIFNLVLYFMYYSMCKCGNSDQSCWYSFIVILLTIGFWVPALIFFFQAPTDWKVVPSRSRLENQDCLLMEFYDVHDLWHFLSSFALFFTFLAIQSLDVGPVVDGTAKENRDPDVEILNR